MKIVNVVGARPNFVKIAPLIAEMRRHPDIEPILVHTGQHYDTAMSTQFFADLQIPPPDVNLEVGSGSHAVQTAEVMKRIEPVLSATRPDVVLVVGDVNSTLAAAVTSAKLGLRIAHVEAGLRSFDRGMPEEINRLLTDQIADWLFVTEESGRQNLLKEGVSSAKIHFVGNVMIDALETCRPRWEASTIVDRVGVDPTVPYAVLTLHRPSNVDNVAELGCLLDALQEIARQLPIIFPMHPRTREQLRRHGYLSSTGEEERRRPADKGIVYVEPLGYLDFIALISRARLVLTDSGGIQEETTILQVPCLTLRDTTERPVTVSHGTNHVVGTDPGQIAERALNVLAKPRPRLARPPLWDGQAAKRIVDILAPREGTSA